MIRFCVVKAVCMDTYFSVVIIYRAVLDAFKLARGFVFMLSPNGRLFNNSASVFGVY